MVGRPVSVPGGNSGGRYCIAEHPPPPASSTCLDFLRHCNQLASPWNVIKWCIYGTLAVIQNEMLCVHLKGYLHIIMDGISKHIIVAGLFVVKVGTTDKCSKINKVLTPVC